MKQLKYKVSIDQDIKRNLKNFKNIIDKILSNKKSWPHKFIQNDYNYDFQIILTPAKKIKKICDFKGLSCTDMYSNIIYINNYRWTKGSKPSKLSLNDYRIYLINHEVGHILGIGHTNPIKNQKVSVMVQQTLGIGDSKPNPWPTKADYKLL